MNRSDKEKKLCQKSKAIWLTGLSGAGKTTISTLLESKLTVNGFTCEILDGDRIRNGINANLSFTLEDRQENIRRVAEISKLFLESGIITINALISPTIASRQLASNIIGEQDFLEIHISTSLEVCETRDVKGLYKKARKGLIRNFTGIDSPYEVPSNPFLKIDTELISAEQACDIIYNNIQPLISH